MPRQIQHKKTNRANIGLPLPGFVDSFIDENGKTVLIDENGNFFRIEKLPFNPVFWEDEVFKLDGSRLFTTAGKVDYDWSEGCVIFEPGGNINNENDLVYCDSQNKHRARLGGEIYPHIHWFQPDNRAYVYTLKYRINYNGQAKNTDWITKTAITNTTDSVFEYTSGTLNQITFFGDGQGVENSGIEVNGLSALIQFKFTRTDVLTGNILGMSFDYHYEIDSYGSDTQSEKFL